MASPASARRYARALFDVVAKSGDVDSALAELKALGAAFTGHPDLGRALTSPGVPLGVKQSVMRDVLALQPVSKVVARLLLRSSRSASPVTRRATSAMFSSPPADRRRSRPRCASCSSSTMCAGVRKRS